MGRTLSTNRRGEERRDLIEIINPPCSKYNPSFDLNDTNAAPVGVLSPMAESIDGRVDIAPPYDPDSPNTLVLGMTEQFRGKPVRNNDPEGCRRRR